MTEPTPRHERDMWDRLRDAYMTARHAGDSNANVGIYVAQDVFDWMKGQATWPLGPKHFEVTTAWGYPVCLEKDWASGRIEVHTVRRIW